MSAPDVATPAMRAAFLRALSGYATGQTLSANSLHEDARLAAQIPGTAMGGLFRGAAEAGLIFEVGSTKATAPAARGRRIVVWERTAKPVPAEALAGAA